MKGGEMLIERKVSETQIVFITINRDIKNMIKINKYSSVKKYINMV